MNWALEKLTRRRSRPAVEVRPATTGDLQQIAAIQAGAPEASQWQPGEYLSYGCSVAVVDGRVAGFLVSRRLAQGQREILNVVVHPAFRRRCIGSALIQRELELWPGEHFLEVRESNYAARGLYRKLGFQEIGLRPGYYEQPSETAIVMRVLS